jgi:uncharacterized protein
MKHVKKTKKTSWIPFVRSLHWMSSAICLVAVFLFAVTGITLNHADSIKANPSVSTIEKILPENLLSQVSGVDEKKQPLSEHLIDWFDEQADLDIPEKSAEWNSDEIYLALAKPGGDAWLSINRETGEWIYEETSRGWIAYLNDLHKGRNTSEAWRWFMDFVSVCCLIFCLSGFWLLWRYSANRRSTYPLLLLGVIAPWVILIISMH